MKQIDVQRTLTISAEQAWGLLSDFGGFLKWAGTGKIELEGEGIGMIRHLEMGAAGKIGERLDLLNHKERVIGYSIVYGDPIGMRTYHARVSLETLSDTQCHIYWQGQFEVVEGQNEDAVSQMLAGAFSGMSDALVAYFSKDT